MRSLVRAVALVAVLALVATACQGDEAVDTGETPTAEDLRGGTIRAAMTADVDAAFDPQKEYYSVTWGFFRLLLRNLMQFPGTPGDEGGSFPQPDLAAAEPTVSEDGRTWAFTLQQGIMYAPPLEDVEVTAQDFIRAIERTSNPEASVGGYPFFYSVIDGFDEFSEGEADSISGLNAPDDYTLEVTTTEPSADMPWIFTLHASSPIPPNPADPDARLGVAEGHDRNYGRFLVATGPYMLEGSEDLDFTIPADDQSPVAGYVPGRSIVLVRNPSWEQATDQLRPAYPDRLEITIGGDNDDLYNQVAAGELDIVLDGIVPAQGIRRYQADPQLQERLFIYESSAVRYISINVAVPPFDDVNVRKAINWALDKAGMRQLRGGPSTGEIAGHIFLPSLTGDYLEGYDPYETPNDAGDIDRAKEAMAESAYDGDGDGVCDDPVCNGVLAVTDEGAPYPRQQALIQENLAPLGITLDVRSLERTPMFDTCLDPTAQVALCLGPGWGYDWPDGVTFGGPLFGSRGLFPACCNFSMLSASPEHLEEHGYEVTDVQNVDADVEACEAMEGEARLECWANLDRKLMEEVVPWVPYLFDFSNDIVAARIINYSFDAFAGIRALDHLAIAAEAR